MKNTFFSNLKQIGIDLVQHALPIQSLKFWPSVDPEKSRLSKIMLIIKQPSIQTAQLMCQSLSSAEALHKHNTHNTFTALLYYLVRTTQPKYTVTFKLLSKATYHCL